MQSSIRQISTSEANVYAFEISGQLDKHDMKGMAATMQQAFDAHEKVNMLLIFKDYEGSEAGAAISTEALQAQWKSLGNVQRYAVVGAPEHAESLIALMDKIVPVNAETFGEDEVDSAWAWVGARPAETLHG